MKTYKQWIWGLLVITTVMTLVSGPAVARSNDPLSTTGSSGSVNIRLHIPQRMQVIALADHHLDSGALHKNLCIAGSFAYQVTVADGTGARDYIARWVDQDGNRSDPVLDGSMLSSRQGGRGGKSCFRNGRKGNRAALTFTPSVRPLTVLVGPE